MVQVSYINSFGLIKGNGFDNNTQEIQVFSFAFFFFPLFTEQIKSFYSFSSIFSD